MFSEAKARRVTQFIECLKHTKGEFHGEPFKLLPWQEKIIRDVFGTVRDDDPSMRQYNTAYIEIPKKNGKSELGAAIALNMLCNDEGRACYAGLDLSSTSDLTAMVLVFPPRDDEEQYIVLPYFWLPEDTLQLRVRRDHVMYDKWERQGFIHTTEGNVVHYGFIEQFITKLGERFNIREIAYDRWNATMMVQTLEDDGFNMVPFGQGFRDMSPPTKELMRIVLERKLNHGGHPVLRWNMDNAFVRTDPAGNLKIDKEKSTEKVDGAVALVMALDRAMKNQGSESVYDTRGLLII